MKKVFNSNAKLSEIWAKQLQNEGRTKNMFFEGSIIYSYGHHYEIGNFIDNGKNEKICFVNSNFYSNSTGKQQGFVYNSIPDGIKVFRVPFEIGTNAYLRRSDFINISVLNKVVNKIMVEIENSVNKQIRAKNNFFHWIDAYTKYSECLEICELFEIEKPCLPKNWFEAEKKHNSIKNK